MTLADALPWALLALLGLGLSALFSGIETGIISIRRLRLRHREKEGRKEARILRQFLDQPDRLLGTTLVGTNLCVVAASVLTASESVITSMPRW